MFPRPMTPEEREIHRQMKKRLFKPVECPKCAELEAQVKELTHDCADSDYAHRWHYDRVVELEAAIQAALDRSHRARFSTGKEYVWMDIDTAERLRALIPERE